MSIKILPKEEIDAIVTWAFAYGMQTGITFLDFDKSTREAPSVSIVKMDADQMGAWLMEANNKALEGEWGPGSSEWDGNYTYEYNRGGIEHPAELVKLIGSYFYNCCSWRGWWFSDQREFCNGLINLAVQDLPEYNGEYDSVEQ